MKLQILTILLSSSFAFAQVGINTTNPQTIFNVDGAKDNPTTGAPSDAQQLNDFYVTNSGSVGIGVVAPQAKLDVNGNLDVNSKSAAYGSFIRVRNSDGVIMTVQASNTGTTFGKRGVIGTNTNDELVFIYGTNSILGMNGTTLYPITPSAVNLGSAANRFGTVFSNVNNTPSDIRFKAGIKNLSYGINDVMKIRPVSYYLKDNMDFHPHIGFIAQEMEKIIPEIVSTDKDSVGYKAIDYSKLVPVLVKGMQDQQKTIEALTKRVEELESSQK
ncbi:tail fiber domain-containing protein [Chryseobacterium sp. MYb264]|uniref:tail fiber domain-containing protein n=1 Tax=Chryseobacterium sp. MYb264 TaxID=2745153 RepID=UPI002E13EEBA|nr:tail fiber domain-containing protein [Chryseobacterium sp. MYb264]